MLFNSYQFFIFFPLVVFFYFIIPYKYRWIFLLIASYYFYMSWNPAYIILIILSTLIDYFAGIMMGKTAEIKSRRKYLILSLIANLGLLFTFKYFNFFNDTMRHIFTYMNFNYQIPHSNLLLPVGISFYTFQTLSYTIDVYKGGREPEKHLGYFALYVSFFPQLVAGPIERSTRLLPQFYEKYDVDYDRITDGLKLMMWGLFKKVVIADRVSALVNTVYNNPSDFTGIPLIIATIFFAFQIYCDFSGYSDIAIGGAQVLGFKLMDNFNRPYFSKSIDEFWKRWHISLSTWFRDYLYITLGGNRVSIPRWYLNLFLTFLISGLWHGVNWTFIIWGALNGFYLLFSIWTKHIRHSFNEIIGLNKRPGLHKYIKVGITFFLTCIAWVIFRANSIQDAFYIFSHIITGTWDLILSLIHKEWMNAKFLLTGQGLGMGNRDFILSLISIGIMEYIHLIQRHGRIRHMLKNKPVLFRWFLYFLIVLMILFFGVFNKSQFIYFQF
ncbi:MAG: MBOAT family protein [bacterium]|nr:MBOAT family protein [bacterium]